MKQWCMSNPVKGKGFYSLRGKRSAYPFTLQGCPTEHVKKNLSYVSLVKWEKYLVI